MEPVLLPSVVLQLHLSIQTRHMSSTVPEVQTPPNEVEWLEYDYQPAPSSCSSPSLDGLGKIAIGAAVLVTGKYFRILASSSTKDTPQPRRFRFPRFW